MVGARYDRERERECRERGRNKKERGSDKELILARYERGEREDFKEH